jgi:hypothetical protein
LKNEIRSGNDKDGNEVVWYSLDSNQQFIAERAAVAESPYNAIS